MGEHIALIVVEPFPVPAEVTFAGSVSDRFEEAVGVSTLVPGYKRTAFLGGVDDCEIYDTEAKARAEYAAWMSSHQVDLLAP